jgi:hypothetical protein
MNVFSKLKQRKLVQWTVAYVAAAFALLRGIDISRSEPLLCRLLQSKESVVDRNSHAFDPIRRDERFQAVMKSVGPVPATPVQAAP